MATSWRNKKNYPLGVGTLNTAIDDNDLTIVLDAGQGASFPSASFTISIDEEIILIDSRSTDTLTVNASGRGYDDSTASAHAAGVAIANYQIKKDFTDLEAAINGIENGTTTLAKVITSGSAASTMTVDDSGTNTAVSILELYHTSSGTPASGLGAKLLLGAEDSAGNKEAAIELHGILTTVTNTSEQGKFLLRIKNAGSFIDALAITVASNTATVGSNQTTVNLWNTTATTINLGGVCTALNIGAATGATTIANDLNVTGATSGGGLTLGLTGSTVNKYITVNTRAASEAGIQLQSAGSAAWYIYRPASSTNLRFNNGTTDIVTFTSAGVTTIAGGSLTVSAASNAAVVAAGAALLEQPTSTSVRLSQTSGTSFSTWTWQHNYTGTGNALFNVDFSSSSPAMQNIRFFRSTPAAAGVVQIAIHSPNTLTENIVFDAKTGNITTVGALTVNGSGSVFGDASTDTFTFTGRMIVRSVTDAGPMTATGGSTGEIVRNTSDNKFYGCTVGHASAATWVAFN